MNVRLSILSTAIVGIALSGYITAETFVVNKKKPQKQSMSKLKEQYGDELAELIRIIPGLQKTLADLQERLINELYILLDDDMNLNRVELDAHICKAQDLRCFLDTEVNCLLTEKSAFIKKAAPAEKPNQTTKDAAVVQ